MPTVLRVAGFRFFFFSNEGLEPPHIHVERGECYAKCWLGPARLASSVGFRGHELRRVRRLVEEHEELLRRSWDEHFGCRA